MAQVKITLPKRGAQHGAIEVDGKDISHLVKEFRVAGVAGGRVEVRLTLVPDSVEIIADDATVHALAIGDSDKTFAEKLSKRLAVLVTRHGGATLG